MGLFTLIEARSASLCRRVRQRCARRETRESAGIGPAALAGGAVLVVVERWCRDAGLPPRRARLSPGCGRIGDLPDRAVQCEGSPLFD